MTILKDAASTAIYGSKAANGVVVIETKNRNKVNLKFRMSVILVSRCRIFPIII
ncbi:MAG: hypothetical protein ACLU4N_21475 [Butyricimonas faecihominis]